MRIFLRGLDFFVGLAKYWLKKSKHVRSFQHAIFKKRKTGFDFYMRT